MKEFYIKESSFYHLLITFTTINHTLNPMKNFLCTLTLGFALLFSFPVSAQITFNNEYGGPDNEDGRWMEQTADSGFIMVGSTTSYGNGQNDFWLVKNRCYRQPGLAKDKRRQWF